MTSSARPGLVPGPRRRFVSGLFGLTGAAAAASSPRSNKPAATAGFNVRELGAAADGARLDTQAIQQTIDACARAGGGTVRFPAGRYLSGTLLLRSRVTLHLEAGAVLLGSKSLSDYPPHIPEMRSYTDNYTDKSLLYAENLEHIAIEGRGVIDGQGAAFPGPYKVRPYLIRMIHCRNIAVTGVTIQDSPMWVQHYLACDDVEIHGITVRSRVNHNNDGIDIDGCHRVRISGCNIWSGDDAIVLKSTADRPCRDISISNCVLSSVCSAVKLGTETNGGFENIAVSNCAIYDTNKAGVTLQIVDGGTLDGVTVSNITMRNVVVPIFIRLGDRGRPFVEGGPRPAPGRMRNARISNVEAVGASVKGCAIAGLPGQAIENLTLEGIRLQFQGGGARRDLQVPESADKYPECTMFGDLPAYGLYCRHIRNLKLRDIETTFAKTDPRPALVCDDVDGLELAGAGFAAIPSGPAVRMNDVKDALIQGCRLRGDVDTWLEVSSAGTRRVSLCGNDLSRAAHPVRRAAGVPPEAVFLAANRTLS